MIKFIDDKKNAVWINPRQVTVCTNKGDNFQVEFTGNEYVDFPKNNEINCNAFAELTTGNRLINEQEKELIRKHNKEASS